jgi:hypothetical protein
VNVDRSSPFRAGEHQLAMGDAVGDLGAVPRLGTHPEPAGRQRRDHHVVVERTHLHHQVQTVLGRKARDAGGADVVHGEGIRHQLTHQLDVRRRLDDPLGSMRHDLHPLRERLIREGHPLTLDRARGPDPLVRTRPSRRAQFW